MLHCGKVLRTFLLGAMTIASAVSNSLNKKRLKVDNAKLPGQNARR